MADHKTHLMPEMTGSSERALRIAGWLTGIYFIIELTIGFYTGGLNGHGDFTKHGMRSAFTDWAGDCTSFDEETRQFAIAHQIPDKATKAYRRYSALGKRRQLMEAWCKYCSGMPVESTDNVVPIGGMVSSTVLTLVVIVVIYAMVKGMRLPSRARTAEANAEAAPPADHPAPA